MIVTRESVLFVKLKWVQSPNPPGDETLAQVFPRAVFACPLKSKRSASHSASAQTPGVFVSVNDMCVPVSQSNVAPVNVPAVTEPAEVPPKVTDEALAKLKLFAVVVPPLKANIPPVFADVVLVTAIA